MKYGRSISCRIEKVQVESARSPYWSPALIVTVMTSFNWNELLFSSVNTLSDHVFAIAIIRSPVPVTTAVVESGLISLLNVTTIFSMGETFTSFFTGT